MKITPVSMININPSKPLQSKGSFYAASFKRKEKATADDSKISWGGIALLTVMAFTAAAITVSRAKKSFGHIFEYAKDFEGRVNNFGRKLGYKNRAPKNIPQVPKLEIDVAKLRQLPTDIKRQAKAAINAAVTSDEYQQVLKYFNIGKIISPKA